MNLTTILQYLAPFEALLVPELLKLEGSGMTELNTLIGSVTSPDLKALLTALSGAMDAFAKIEIQKL